MYSYMLSGAPLTITKRPNHLYIKNWMKEMFLELQFSKEEYWAIMRKEIMLFVVTGKTADKF